MALLLPYTLTGTAAATTNATFPLILGVIILYRGLNANIDEVRVWSGLKLKHNLLLTQWQNMYWTWFVSLLFFAEGNKQFVYDTTTSDTAIVLNADTNGLGEGKFWNTRFFYKVWNWKINFHRLMMQLLKPILYC
jgi:hypothetical protein